MKKFTLLLMVVLTISACKKREAGTQDVQTDSGKTASEPDCLNLNDYYKLSDIDKKAEWLRLKGDRVCDSILEEAVLRDHKLKNTVSINDQKEKYVIKWGDLKKIIGSHGYDAYLNVVIKKEKINSLKMVKMYGEGTYCFSTALIKSLAKKYAKDDSAKFQFSFTEINQELTKSLQTAVVIQVDENSYYDYSTDPGFISLDNMPL